MNNINQSRSLIITRTQTVKLLLMVLFVSMCLQNVVLLDLGGFGIKLSHVVSLLFLPLLYKVKIILPNRIINFAYLGFGLISLIAGFFYGLNSLLFNYIFGYYVLVISLNILKILTVDEIKKCIRFSASLVFFICVVNIALQFDAILSFLNDSSNGHPLINTVFSGGVNLESSWLGLFVCFFADKKYIKYAFLLLSTIISFLLSSRAGLIINVLTLLYFIINLSKSNRRIVYLCLFVIVIITSIVFSDYIIINLKRFVNIGNESGSIGRIAMWKYIIPALNKNVFGYGVGNSIYAIEQISGIDFVENNIHNIYFQFLLDFGIIGIIFIVGVLIYFINDLIKNKRNIFCAFIVIYYVVGMIEFRGGDALFFLVLGIYFLTKRQGVKVKNGSAEVIRCYT